MSRSFFIQPAFFFINLKTLAATTAMNKTLQATVAMTNTAFGKISNAVTIETAE